MIISCFGVYLSTPQPVDSKNILSFPVKYRGIWTEEGDTVFIEKKYLGYSMTSEEIIPMAELDSASHILKNNKIYLLFEDGTELRGGYPYQIKDDTLRYTAIQLLEVELGKSAFLRKLKKDYILNVKQENQWWILILFKTDKQGNLVVKSLNTSDLQKLVNLYPIHSYDDYKYTRLDFIEASWTKKELIKMIDEGLFSDTIRILDTNGKIRYQ